MSIVIAKKVFHSAFKGISWARKISGEKFSIKSLTTCQNDILTTIDFQVNKPSFYDLMKFMKIRD